ncbi:hypothetical protein [uncultured Ellagibacter sp.]|uniref:hypothetical protein n=1 Tax=uncultured Ellagibacter sp. TaxID=2137580 RepID=UPI0026247299|nr:hypothetical protein [uncultured Ellagibacter sp.]
MKTIKIRMEYECYPVWLYDSEGFVEDTALPLELANDQELDEKFKSLQSQFDATYVDTPTAFFNKGFTSPKEEKNFKDDLKAAVIELMEKCPSIYSIEVSPELID